jgi:hypothetical protein
MNTQHAAAAATAAATDHPRGWFAILRQPVTVHDLWRRCCINAARHRSNRIARMGLFALILACPAVLVAPLLRLADRISTTSTELVLVRPPTRAERLRAATADAAVTWIGVTRRPVTIREAWRRSGSLDKDRIPAGSNLLAFFWTISNVTDRLFLFALVVICPTGLLGPLLYVAERPMRRVGFLLVWWLVTVFVPALAVN